MQSGGQALGTGCTINAQTDAVEPFDLTATNTTHGFAYGPHMNIAVVYPSDQLSTIEADVTIAGQPTCITFNGYTGPEDGESGNIDFDMGNVQPGQSGEFGGFFVITNYYSPASPGGSSSLTAGVSIVINGSDSGSVTAQSGFTSIGGEVPMPATMPLDPTATGSSNSGNTGTVSPGNLP